MSDNLPTGVVTFLFTDIEGSTQLWERQPEAMKAALAGHDRLLRAAVEANNGRVVKTTGDGCHAVFATVADALAAALDAQRALGDRPLRSPKTSQISNSEVSTVTIRSRMAIHAGEAELRDGDYYGPTLNRAARIMSTGHGGQVLLSAVAAALLDGRLPVSVTLRDLGEHRLKDLSRPERIFQASAAGLAADFPPLQSLDTVPGNLPVQLTAFVGRGRELAEVKRLLTTTRLLTLTGPGGTGKTRLSLQVAADVQADYAHGAWLAELAPLADPALVPAAVAGLFALAPGQGQTPAATLTDYLRGKQLLLILDNCEHLVEACARLAADLLAACPRLTILASSREGLRVPGETTYHVPTLALPSPGETTAATVCRHDAADLFVQRARAAQPTFTVTDANAAAVAQIVRRLDGIPLAIELAAARVRLLSPEQIAVRLNDRFRLLTGGSRTALPRQQTLRALIDWSYALFSTEEATLFRRLGVFVDGWTLEAAEAVVTEAVVTEAVANDERPAAIEPAWIGKEEVLDLLAGLVNKSMVTIDETETGQRYRYLESIRQYARDKLFESGEGEAARDRHATYYDQALRAPLDLDIIFASIDFLSLTAHIDIARWVRDMERDVENMRAAVEWAVARKRGKGLLMATTMATALSFSFSTTAVGDDNSILRTAIVAADALPQADREATAGRRELQMLAFLVLGNNALGIGDAAAARACYNDAVRLARQGRNPSLLARALVQRSIVAGFQNDNSGLVDAEEGAAVYRELGEPVGVAQALGLMVNFYLRRGDLAQAIPLAEQVQAILKELHELTVPLVSYLTSPFLARLLGDTATAERLYRDGRDAFRRLHNRRFATIMESDLAHMLRQEGRIEEARPIYNRTIHEWHDLGARAPVANMLESFAFIARADNLPERATRLLGAAEALRETIQVDMTAWERQEYDLELAALHEILPAATLAAEWAAGRALEMDAAVDYAVVGSGDKGREEE